MEGHLTMSKKERRRKSAFDNVEEGRMTLVEVSKSLNLSYRQCKRSFKRFRQEGDAGLVHRGRGRSSNRSRPAGFRRAVLDLCDSKYRGFGPTFAAEKLEIEGYILDHETLRRWMIEKGIWTKRRKSGRHRNRRVRKEHFGEMLQMDGSHHAWFGPERPNCCLMNIVDDATGTTLAFFAEEETTVLAMGTLRLWVERYGVPKSIYSDKKTVFFTDREPTMEEQLAGEEPLTAFGKVLKKLGVQGIRAHSPQAKGRVERSHGTYQDRLVKELKLRGIATIQEANQFLVNEFCADLSSKFFYEPAKETDFHSPIPEGLDLSEVFCVETQRTISNDWTVRHENRFYQILKDNNPLPKPKEKVTMRRHLDGTLQLIYRGNPIAYKALSEPPEKKNKSTRNLKTVPKRTNGTYKPPANHPWRRGCTLMPLDPPQQKQGESQYVRL